MKHIMLIFSIILTGCYHKNKLEKEQWIAKPVKDWPDFALTNHLNITDSTFIDFANSFIIDTGKDTIGISCKHAFMLFQSKLGISSISLGNKLNYWNLYPKNNPEKVISVKRIINQNKNEPIGEWRTLKDRDWILFELKNKNNEIYPLKIRYIPVKKGEKVYCIGWGQKQKDNTKPALIEMHCISNEGSFYYMKTIESKHKTNGRSGSAVIDENGYLIGIVSGAEGDLTVIGGVSYLKKQFDKYKIDYTVLK